MRDKLKNISEVILRETDYSVSGYHLALQATTDSLRGVAALLDEERYYLADMLCVDWVDSLEVVYFFAHYDRLDRIKVSLSVDSQTPQAPSISSIYEGAYFWEREIHEFFGVVFTGHRNLTYLFLHEEIDHYPLRKGKVEVTQEARNRLKSKLIEEQEDTFAVNLGPQHPSTHGVLRVIIRMDGEYILEAEPVLGYLHRMQEKMAERRTYNQFLPNTGRMDYLGAMSFNLGYVLAVEKMLRITPPERAIYLRVIATELNRISSHLLWVGAFLADLGALTPFLFVFDDREQILDILEGMTGSRLTYCHFRIGGLAGDIDGNFPSQTRDFIKRMREDRFGLYRKLITGNPIFTSRTRGIGVVKRERARKYGITGPVLRSAGVPFDLRKFEPYSGYDRLSFAIPTGVSGGAFDIYQVRMAEMENSLKIIEQALDLLPDGPVLADKLPKKLKPPKGDLYHTVETPRGELGVYIVSDETEVPYRMKWRVPSFSNLMIFPELARGVLLADAVAALGSLDLVIPEIDR